MLRIGVDLGGTKVEAIALDQDGHTLSRHRTPTPRNDYAGTLHTIKQVVDQVRAVAPDDPFTVGVGMPGSHHPRTGLVQNANSTWLNGQAFGKDLAALLGYTIRTENDANCFALSEAVDGAARDFPSTFGVIVGTGTGGGIVINKQLHDGPNHTGGEWGHIPLPWYDPSTDGPARNCYCGRHNCVETFLSGPGLAKTYRQAGGADELTAAQIADAKDKAAAQALDLYTHQFARGLGVIITMLDPAAIVLGGGVSHIDSLYSDIPKLWDAVAFTDHVETTLLKAAHGDSSGVRGAAWLWPQS